MKKSKVDQHISEGEKVKGFFHRWHMKNVNIRKEFVEFINRGSIIDLAIGVAVGGAFNTIVNSFVNDIITPIVGLLAGGVNFNNLAIHVHNFFGLDDEATISYGKFIQSVIQFLIVAWVFFLLVKAMNSFHRKRDAEVAKLEHTIAKQKEQIAEKFEKQVEKKAEKKSTKEKQPTKK